ncbi:MAG: hypothetical protein IKH26_05465 [Bacteroidaceae bacterium]|nr:hypothetical protein [Bacteroidaceae bacterium]
MKQLFLIITMLSSAMVVCGQTTDRQPVMQFDFSSVSGTTVHEATGTGINASLRGGAKVVEMGDYRILSLGSGSAYFDMTKQAGTLLSGKDTLSISVYYRISDEQNISENGNFLWCFSTSSACTATGGKFTAYRVNAQRASTSQGGYQQQQFVEVGSPSERGAWKHVVYIQEKARGRLYIDGKLIGTNTQMFVNSANYTTSPSYCWIGRSPFSGDAYLHNTLVSDFRLYNVALTADEVKKLATKTELLEQAYRFGTPGDVSALTAAVTEGKAFAESSEALAYPPLALLEYKDALRMADIVAQDGRLSQTVVDARLKALKDARTQLETTRNFVFPLSDVRQAYDRDRGFVHPGGLHTEADFERIRRQISEGNTAVKAAYNRLCKDNLGQSNKIVSPVKTIIRNGGTGDAYINAAQGAACIYMNALRWKIDGSKAHARNAVKNLMAWVDMDSNVSGGEYVLCAVYGFQFAQGAELLRDFGEWSEEDQSRCRRWMVNTWYRVANDFLHWHNGQWVNADSWYGYRPGSFWSNWELCCALCMVSVGVFCDDVYMYNQGLSYLKYDQLYGYDRCCNKKISEKCDCPETVTAAAYHYQNYEPTVPYLYNDGCMGFMGNLIPVLHDDDRGPYGKLGQMQESGRDQGHCLMSIGLASDICQTAWSQGDDLYGYMDNRMAAGAEFVAAYNYADLEDLPWTEYRYADRLTAFSENVWCMTGPSATTRGGMRPIWNRLVGHYEGVRGREMKYSRMAVAAQGEDYGGQQYASGYYDHLGYTILTCTPDSLPSADYVPTFLTGKLSYNGLTADRNDLGGTTNDRWEWYKDNAVPRGTQITLMPQLPDGEEDTGLWQWNTGATTRNITVGGDHSYVYRVTYTNAHGVKSQQAFPIAFSGDNTPSLLTGSVACNGKETADTIVRATFGEPVTLSVTSTTAYGIYLWEDGRTGASITLPNVTEDRDISVLHSNVSGTLSRLTFHIRVDMLHADAVVAGKALTDSTIVYANEGSEVILSPRVSEELGTWLWDDGTVTRQLTLSDVTTSSVHTVTYTIAGQPYQVTYQVLVLPKSVPPVDNGYYLIATCDERYFLTNEGGTGSLPGLASLRGTKEDPDTSQIWYIGHTSTTSHSIMSASDSLYVNAQGKLTKTPLRTFRVNRATETPLVAFYTTSRGYWTTEGATIDFAGSKEFPGLPFCLIPVSYVPTAIDTPLLDKMDSAPVYDISGRLLDKSSVLPRGIYTQNGRKFIVR